MIGTEPHLERARLLLAQKRIKDAEKEIGYVLKDDPENASALLLLAECKTDAKQFDEATLLLKKCIGAEPDNDRPHYLLGFAYYQKSDTAAAKKSLNTAIQLNPWASAYFGLYAYVLLEERAYKEALEKANNGLNIYAEDLTCLNARSQALFRLNQHGEAYDTIKEALAANPEDDFTHTNYGWHFLEKGKYKEALTHFTEALRINPVNSRAREGYKAALKSKLPFYRWILQFSLWMGHQQKAVRFGIIIGIWILVRVVAALGENSPLRYAAFGIVALYMLFVLFSWLGSAFANLYLLFTKHGKLVLDTSEKWSAVLVGVSITAGIFLFSLEYFFDQKGLFFPALILCTMPIAIDRLEFPIKMFKGSARLIMAQILFLLGILSIIGFSFSAAVGLGFGLFYLILFLGFMWSGSFGLGK